MKEGDVKCPRLPDQYSDPQVSYVDWYLLSACLLAFLACCSTGSGILIVWNRSM
jgi:hypothetical protein